MDSKEFITYVRDQRRIGLDDNQIARKLGMDAGAFEDVCKFAFEEEVAPKVPNQKAVEAVTQKTRKEKVPGIYYVPQNDDDEFMNTPIVKSKKENTEKAEPAEK